MNREGVATVEILPDVAGFAVAMACATIHPRSEWERAVQRIVDTLAGSRDDLLALLRTLPGSGWTPAEAAAAAELIASRPASGWPACVSG